jgi:hypothetical protein
MVHRKYYILQSKLYTIFMIEFQDAFPVLNSEATKLVKKAKKYGMLVGHLMRALFAPEEITDNTTVTGGGGASNTVALDVRRINLIISKYLSLLTNFPVMPVFHIKMPILLAFVSVDYVFQ